MTLNQIFKDGKLKPGIYKIQNLSSRTYLDVDESLRDVCCRPAAALEEGMGLVCPFYWPVACAPDDSKWKINPLGAGYSIQRVSVPIPPARLSKFVTACLMARNPG